MFNKKLLIYFKSEKGSSIVMVLSVIIIMTMLGSVALITSASSYKLGSKYKNWTDQYYQLDSEGDTNLNKLDTLLAQAEKYTQKYIQNECYANELSSSIADEYDLNDDQHDFLYQQYLSTLTTVTQTVGQDEEGNDITSQRTYMDPDDLEDFLTEAYTYLYYFYTYNLLQAGYGGYAFNNNITNSRYADGSLTWGEHDGINIEKILDDEDKKITALIEVLEPQFDPNIQDTYYTFKGNPLWSNALTAGGSIRFTSEAQVYGDIVANNGTVSCEGDNVDVNIYGNIYSNDDIIISGTSSSLIVNNFHADTDREIKNAIFGDNNLFLDLDYLNAPSYTEDYVDSLESPTYIPFIYNDVEGGNAYCNSLKIDDSSQNSDITIEGHVWTYDDIELDGGESSITINGNYIGINSEASDITGDPNASSSIINNKYEENSQITLNGNIVVPGVAFIPFDERTYTDEFGAEQVDNGDGDGIYYRLAESVSAKNPQIFYTYSDGWTAVSEDYGTYTLNGDDMFGDSNFYLKEAGWGDFLSFFITNVQTKADPGTNIHILDDGDIEGYTLGSVCAENTSGFTFDRVITESNDDAYWALTGSNELQDIFTSKTKMFGLTQFPGDSPSGTLEDFVDKDVITEDQKEIAYLTGDKEIDISDLEDNQEEGIIYCTGDLTVKGSGTFKGTIIAEGDMTVSEGVTIQYDEDVIARTIVESEIADDFFAPGAQGDYVYYRKQTSSSGQVSYTDGTTSRFRVVQWIYE